MSGSKKRKRSLPSLLNPFALLRGMGNTTRNGINNNDDEKSVETNLNDTSNDGIWSPSKLKNNIQIQYLSGHNDIVRCLCKLDEDRFASSSDDGLILIWSINNGLLLDVLCGHTASILSLLIIQYKAYKLLISASLDHTIRIWDITNPLKQIQCVSILTDHNSPIIKIISFNKTKKMSQNGLITASNDGLIGVWGINENFDFNAIENVENAENTENSSCLFNLLRIINTKEKDIEMTEMLFLNTSTANQLIIGCKTGRIIFINFDRNDRIKLINKHLSSIRIIYQLCVDRFISASYDGLICVWRIESTFPQLLERINDVQHNISSWSKLPKPIQTETNNNKYNKYNKNNKNNKKLEIITEAKDLKLNCFIDFIDQYDDKYFIVSFSNSFVIFDTKFLVKSIIKNIYDDNTEIIEMTVFGKKNNLILITANTKHIIKLWNLNKINLKGIKTGIWLSCFRQELLYNLDQNKWSKNKKNNKNNKYMVNDLCIDADILLINKFKFHSDEIIKIKNLNTFTFISCDKMNQIILWKDAYYVSNLQNQTIKKYYNLPSCN